MRNTEGLECERGEREGTAGKRGVGKAARNALTSLPTRCNEGFDAGGSRKFIMRPVFVSSLFIVPFYRFLFSYLFPIFFSLLLSGKSNLAFLERGTGNFLHGEISFSVDHRELSDTINLDESVF